MYCPLKFHNCLPMVPCEQKLMAFPFDSERFIKYSLTTLEAQYSPPLLLPLDLGVTVDLIHPEIYESMISEDPSFDDLELLIEQIKPSNEPKVSRDYSNSSGYLRKSTLPAGPIAYSHPVEAKEDKPELDVEAEFDSITLIPKINAAFEKKEFSHPTKPHLKAEKIYNVLPDEHQLCTEFVLFAYDEEPDDSQNMNVLKEFADDEDTHLLSLYVNNNESEEEDEEEEEVEKDPKMMKLKFLRNYKYSYLNDPNQNDILMWLDEENSVVSYCIVENKMQLKKKPMPKTQGNAVSAPERVLGIKFREENKSELIVRKDKLLEYGFQVEDGMETPILNAMTDDLYDDKNEILNKLFGDDEEDSGSDS